MFLNQNIFSILFPFFGISENNLEKEWHYTVFIHFKENEFIYFSAVLCGMEDLVSLSMHWTVQRKHRVLTPGPSGKSQIKSILKLSFSR